VFAKVGTAFKTCVTIVHDNTTVASVILTAQFLDSDFLVEWK